MAKKPEVARMPASGPRNTNDIRPAVSAYVTRYFTPPTGTMPGDLLEPAYWKHIVAELKLKRQDVIRVCCKDGSWEATYVVVHTGPLHAKLRIHRPGADGIDWIERETELPAATSSHEIVDGGEVRGWIVRRLSDKETIKEGFETEDQAIIWMHENSKLIAA